MYYVYVMYSELDHVMYSELDHGFLYGVHCSSHIPILPPEQIGAEQPDYVLILPWNIAEEMQQKIAALNERETQFVTAVAELKVS